MADPWLCDAIIVRLSGHFNSGEQCNRVLAIYFGGGDAFTLFQLCVLVTDFVLVATLIIKVA